MPRVVTPRARKIHLPFPLAGLDKSGAYTDQPPHTSPDCQNVRGFGTTERRARGGQRPGLAKLYEEQLGVALGGGAPVRMLEQVTVVYTSGGDFPLIFSDEFDRNGATLGPGWSTPSWLGVESPTKIIIGGALTYKGESGGVCDDLSIDTSSLYTVGIRISPWKNQHWGRYRLYLRMTDVNPDVTQNGVEIDLKLLGNAGAYSGRARVYHGGVMTLYALTGGATGSATAGWLKADINGNILLVTWQGNTIFHANVGAHAGSRVGFGMKTLGTYPAGLCLTDVFTVTGAPGDCDDGNPMRTYLVGGARDNIYWEKAIGKMTQVLGDTAHISQDHMTQGAEHLQKLYIADYGTRCLCEDDGVCAADLVPALTDLSSPSVADWTAYGIDVDTDLVHIYNGTGTVVDGVYTINAVHVGYIEVVAPGMVGTCSFRIERAPKIFDPKAAEGSQVTLWMATAGLGYVPVGCPLICAYRSRLVLGGNPPHQWFMSRMDDPLDWLYVGGDARGPCTGTNSNAGQIGHVLTAMIPWRDQFLTFGCTDSIWVLRGDPMDDGRIDAVSRTVGILNRAGWCQGPYGEVYFLSSEGLCVMAPGANAIRNPYSSEVLTSLSEQYLPRELRNVSPDKYEIILGWDAAHQGVHIFLAPTVITGGTDELGHWFWDARLQSFWPDTHIFNYSPMAVLDYKTNEMAYRRLIVGGVDGYLRYYDPMMSTDDGTAFTSYVVLSPVRPSGNDYEAGVLGEIIGAMGEGSGDVDWEAYCGDSHEQALNAAVRASGTWDETGREHSVWDRPGGGSVAIKILGTSGMPWMFEGLSAIGWPMGRVKRL